MQIRVFTWDILDFATVQSLSIKPRKYDLGMSVATHNRCTRILFFLHLPAIDHQT